MGNNAGLDETKKDEKVDEILDEGNFKEESVLTSDNQKDQDKKMEESEGISSELKPSDKIKDLEAELDKSRLDLKAAEDRYLRGMAELENFKKRSTRENDEFRKYANFALVQKLLPALDNLERAMGASSSEAGLSAIIEGLNITLSDILKVFAEFNIHEVKAEAEVFNPAYHMAVAHEETDTAPADSITKVFQKGYIMHDRLLRPAMVAVAKAKSSSEEDKDN